MSLDAVLDRLDGVRKNGKGYAAICPAHPDRNPSLSISSGEDDRVLLTCHAGCSFNDIVKAMGLEPKDLFAPSSGNGGIRPATNKEERPAPEPIADAVVDRLHEALSEKARHYLCKERMLTQEVVDHYQLGMEERNEEKRITIPIRDAQGQVRDIRRWLAPERRTPNSPKMLHWKSGYGAPRLFPEDQLECDELVACEGELDALALIGHGIAAVTLTASADTTFDDSTARRFHGKTVTILMDKDEPGRKGARKRADALVSFAKEVRIASWADDREKGWDVTDELKEHGIESVRDILAAAVPYESEEPSAPSVEKVKPFPTEGLADSIRRLIEEGAAAMQCAPDLIGVPLLVAVGAAIGNSRRLRLKKGWEERSALYAAPIAAPGGAKTHAYNLALEPVHHEANQLRRQYEQEKAAHEAECAQRPEKEKGPRPERPTMKRVVISDATVEAVAPILQQNPRGVLLGREELSGFAQSLNAYKGGKGADRQFYLSTWNGVSTSVDRKKQDEPLFLEEPFLAIAGTIQPDCVRALLHEARWDDGFLDRFLFAFPDYQPVREWTEAVVSDTTKQAVGDVFQRLYRLEMGVDGPEVLVLDDEAKHLWVEWFNHTQRELRDVPETLRGAWSKMPNQCGRLILICHLCRWAAGEADDASIVDVSSVASGTLLAEYFKSHARRVLHVLNEGEEEAMRRRVADWIIRKGNTGLRPRDVVAARIPGIEKADAARELLESLVERGSGEWRPSPSTPSGQRKADLFFLL